MTTALRRFDGKNILITGAASGIGRASAIRFAEEGGNVALLDVNEAGLASTAAECQKHGGKVFTTLCDVTSYENVNAAVDAGAEALGGIHVLAHIAGVLKTFHTHEMKPEDWHRIVGINLHGTFYVNQAALRHLLKNKHSAIVNMSSTSAIGKHPWMAAYAASKGGIAALTQTLAVEYCTDGVRVNAVAPGSVTSGITTGVEFPADLTKEEGRLVRRIMSPTGFGDPADVAAVIAMLASDDGRHVTGEIVRIDGGTHA